MQNGSHLWQLALQKRKEGRCPLEPGEVAVIDHVIMFYTWKTCKNVFSYLDVSETRFNIPSKTRIVKPGFQP